MSRKDAKLVGNLDSMHIIVPLLYPGRCDNEAYISERIDLTSINNYLKEKNEKLTTAASDGNVIKIRQIWHKIVFGHCL